MRDYINHPRSGVRALFYLLVFLTPAFTRAEETPYPEVGPGLEYRHERIGDVPWAIHLLKIDLTRKDFSIITTLAQDTIFGLSTVRSQVAALPVETGKAVAAVNGDFFVIKPGPYQGDPQGLQIMNEELVSAPVGACFWRDPTGRPRIEEVQPRFDVAWPEGTKTAFGLNQERADDAVVLYTPRLGASTRTTGGREFVLERSGDGPWLPLQVGRTYRARIREVRETGGNAPLTADTMVLSVGPGRLENLPALQPGAEVALSTVTSPDLKGVKTAIGAGPVLLHDGAKLPFDPAGPRHPRTALGFNETHLFFVVVDGRRKDLSNGMTFVELADLMARIGCKEAMNLDGGGSSTFWLGGKVMNVPSDGRERGVANALVLVRTSPASEAVPPATAQ